MQLGLMGTQPRIKEGFRGVTYMILNVQFNVQFFIKKEMKWLNDLSIKYVKQKTWYHDVLK